MEDDQKIRDFIRANWQKMTDYEMAEALAKEGVNISWAGLRQRRQRMGFKKSASGVRRREAPPERVVIPIVNKDEEGKKKGIESRNDGDVLINWSTGQIVTNLGEYGTDVRSIQEHGMIQRAYSEMFGGKAENQEEIARRFNFLNARAVARYVRIHGVRHSSLPFSDIEMEDPAFNEETATEEVLQSYRHRVHKKVQTALWKDTQDAADNWRRFEESVLNPLREDIRTNLPNYTPPKLELDKSDVPPFVAVIGTSDWHFAKFAYDANGKQTYGVKQAIEALVTTGADNLQKLLRYGVPGRFVMVVGSDNFHIDTPFKTTTKGTPQDVEGEYEILIKPYINAVINHIEMYRQVGVPVDLVVIPGNHDQVTSAWLGHLLSFRYEDAEDVQVILRTHPRVYVQHGRYCFGFTHGATEFTSQGKKDRNIHKLFLTEARDQGVDINKIDHFYMFAGNLHFEESRDYGMVSYKQMPALCGDDRWHKGEGFVGQMKQTRAYCIDLKSGLVAEFASAIVR